MVEMAVESEVTLADMDVDRLASEFVATRTEVDSELVAVDASELTAVDSDVDMLLTLVERLDTVLVVDERPVDSELRPFDVERLSTVLPVVERPVDNELTAVALGVDSEPMPVDSRLIDVE